MFKQTTGQRHDDSRVFLVAFQGAVLADTRALILYTWYSSTTAVGTFGTCTRCTYVQQYIGGPRAYQGQFRGFTSHQVHARKRLFLS